MTFVIFASVLNDEIAHGVRRKIVEAKGFLVSSFLDERRLAAFGRV